MSIETGIALSFVAMLCWGFGDFFIQRSTRKIGDWETLFAITLFGTVVLAPFVWDSLMGIFQPGHGFDLLILVGCALVLFVAALLDFEALKIGKITVVEPIWSTEIIISALLAFFILREGLGIYQIVLIAVLILGLMLVSVKEKGNLKIKNFFLERGVIIAFLAAVVMGFANFMMGWGSRISDPILVNFMVNIIITVLSGAYIIYRRTWGKMFSDFRENFRLVLTMSITDNLAWIAFAFAMSLAPIGVAVALSESYIIIAVILGFVINKEKLQRHQKAGLALALIGAITLAVITA